MLSIMSLAFQGAGINELATPKGDSPDERRKQIFRLFLKKMFRRKGTASPVFPKGKIVGWLSWLAAKMRERSQSVFLVEGIQPSWLDKGAQLVAHRTAAALSAGLIFGLISGLILGLTSGLGFGLTSGLISGLILLAGVSLGCLEFGP
jgi:hypothetical protein